MKKRSGFHKSVWDVDKTGLPEKRGYLRKRATNGSWQKRFFQVNNAHFNYYASGKADIVKASIDLRDVVDAPYLVDRFGEFVIELGNEDRKYRLRAENIDAAKEWMDVLEARRQHFLHNEEIVVAKPRGESSSSDSTCATGSMPSTPVGSTFSTIAEGGAWNDSDAVVTEAAEQIATLRKEGVLEKCSPSRFKAWQERYFKLINGSMYYYKSAKVADADYLGEIVVDDSCVVERYDVRAFRIRTRFRMYELQAPNSEIREEWMNELLTLQAELRSIEQRMTQQATQEEQRRLAAMRELAHQPPEWILKFDARERSANVELIQGMLRERFRDCTGDLIATINAATSLIEEMDDMARECLPSIEGHGAGGKLTEAGRTPRVDVFAICLREYHISLVNEISQLGSNERLDGTSSQGLLRLMDLIRAYGDKLEEVMIDPLRIELGCVLGSQDMGNVPAMAMLYIDRLLARLGSWVDEIVAANLLVGEGSEARVQIRANGLVSTPAPIDMFNMVNETLTMVLSSGVKELTAEALSICLTTVSDYMHITMDQVEEESTPLSCLMLCALSNDCWLVGEQLDVLESTQSTILEYSGLSFDSVHELYNDAALALLSRVADIVFMDLKSLGDQLFTRKHLQPDSDELIHNIMARIGATVEDYLADLGRMLEPPYVIRVAKVCASRCVASYCGRLLKNVVSDAKGIKSVFGVKGGGENSNDSIRKVDDNILDKIRDDAGRLHTCFDSLAGELFANETCLLDDILELLTVSPDFVPMTLRAICEREAPELHPVAFFVVECVLRLRDDIDVFERAEILVECKKVATKMSQVTSTAAAPAVTHSYLMLASALPSGTLPPVVQVAQDKQIKKGGEGAGGTEVARKPRRSLVGISSMVKNAPTDISHEASRQRRDLRKQRISVLHIDDTSMAKDYDTVELSGYLDKKNPSGIWQRRWFVVRRMFDKVSGTWPQALAWHNDHTSAPKSHLFVNDVISIIPCMVGGLKTQGSSLELLAGVKRKKKGDSEREFRVVCKGRVFVLRARSVHEMLTWVNGLRRACVRNVPRANNSPPLKTARQDLRNMSLKGLRAFNSARGRTPTLDQTKKVLSQLMDGSGSESDGSNYSSNNNYDSGGERSVQEQRDFANDAWELERRRIVGSRTITQLRQACERANINTFGLVEKDQLVDVLLNHIHKTRADSGTSGESGFSSKSSASSTSWNVAHSNGGDEGVSESEDVARKTVDKLEDARSRVDSVALELSANIMSMVRMGYEHVEQCNYFEGIAMFDKAAREARQLNNKLYEAHAMAGLGCAYNETEERASAAPMMFEMAANLYKEAGETSCHLSTLIDAANAFASKGFYDEALRCLAGGGGGGVPILAKKMDDVKVMMKARR